MIRQNTLTDKKGKPRFQHNIQLVLGLLDRGPGKNGEKIDFTNLEEISEEEWEVIQQTDKTVKRPQKSVTARPQSRKFRNPLDLLNEFKQRGRSDDREVTVVGDLLSPIGQPIQVEERVIEEVLEDDDEDEENFKRPPITFTRE